MRIFVEVNRHIGLIQDFFIMAFAFLPLFGVNLFRFNVNNIFRYDFNARIGKGVNRFYFAVGFNYAINELALNYAAERFDNLTFGIVQSVGAAVGFFFVTMRNADIITGRRLVNPAGTFSLG